MASINITSSEGLRFKGTIRSYTSDMAIDDVTIRTGYCLRL